MTAKKKKKRKSLPIQASAQQRTTHSQPHRHKKNFVWLFLFLVIGITAICLSPMLQNGFTNWDDEVYITGNQLLIGPDWYGVFTKAVVENYHPLTIISLAINYQLFGLNPLSYQLFNLLLHLINTALVFYFIWSVSGKNRWVAFISALIFGIHPMHVESVSWLSERKDVLYAFFFLLSLLQYWRFLQTGNRLNFWLCFLLFVLSLLSKPSAIILPLVLLLLDYWKDRPITLKTIIEKIPFFLLSILFAIITVQVQSTKAIASLDQFPLWTRPFFASYTLMIYFFRFFIPYPLSAFHPYPPPDDLGLPILISPVFFLILVAFLWFQRKNKLLVFGFLFFLINLLLVMQFVSIGGSIISERYTYVPYIGLAFILATLLDRYITSTSIKWIIPAVIVLIFGIISFQRTKIWKDSGTLWTNVIKHYPNAIIPRNKRAHYTTLLAASKTNQSEANQLFLQALEDCNVAIELKPDRAINYEDREFINLNLNRDKDAMADATTLIKLDPDNKLGYYTRGMVYMRFNEPEKAFADFNKAISISPDYHNALNNRGAVLLNYYQKYSEALADFDKAIQIKPQGNYYLNRSICYYKLGNMAKAKEDAKIAVQMGTAIPDNYRKAINF